LLITPLLLLNAIIDYCHYAIIATLIDGWCHYIYYATPH
jgi:hypothetical protein